MSEKVYSNVLLSVEAGLRSNKALHSLHLEIDSYKVKAYRELQTLDREEDSKDFLYWKTIIETLDKVEIWAKPEPTVLD